MTLSSENLGSLRARIAALETLLDVTRELTAELDHEALLKKNSERGDAGFAQHRRFVALV